MSSSRNQGYDDPYGYKSRERTSHGDPNYYQKEKKYHDDAWHDERREQIRSYHEDHDFDSHTTSSVRDRIPNYYPRRKDPKEFSKYLENQRTSLVTENKDWKKIEDERKAATNDNARAHHLRKKSSWHRDYGYGERHVLHRDYKRAVNERDNLVTGEGPGRKKYEDY
jgi:hypothetical protein